MLTFLYFKSEEDDELLSPVDDPPLNGRSLIRIFLKAITIRGNMSGGMSELEGVSGGGVG